MLSSQGESIVVNIMQLYLLEIASSTKAFSLLQLEQIRGKKML